jgi:hypothetical protein
MNREQEVETIHDASGKWRITILRREDGRYTLHWERFSDDPYEMCWIGVMNRGVSFFDTLETARREARGRLGLPPN